MQELKRSSAAPKAQESESSWAEQRRAGNIRLAWGMVGFAVMVFLLAVWKYRPL